MPSERDIPVVFTAQSKMFFYCRDAVCEFVFQQNAIPVNPFRVFEYFLGDRVERNLVRAGNNALIRIVNELWVFGETIADGVSEKTLLERELTKPIRYFTIDNRATNIKEVEPDNLNFEREVYAKTKLTKIQLLVSIFGYDPTRQFNLFREDAGK